MPFFVTTKAGGMCMVMPDTCKTPVPGAPPVPVPYPNMGTCMMTDPSTCSTKVTIMGMPPLSQMSQIPMTSGDEAGSAGGVISGKIKGEVLFKTFSAKVTIEGQGVVFQTCTTSQNGTNANAQGGIQVDPSQTKVIVGG